MSTQIYITELYADALSCSVIRSYLQLNHLSDLCQIKEEDGSKVVTLRNQGQEKIYTAPIRMGTLLDQLLYYKNNKPDHAACIKFKGGTLNIHQGVFTNKKDDRISLTEKEIEILSFLHKNKGHIISRETLLTAVWGYADNVETHTLETHIYRLRQKIEHNPANPEILITENDGYRV